MMNYDLFRVITVERHTQGEKTQDNAEPPLCVEIHVSQESLPGSLFSVSNFYGENSPLCLLSSPISKEGQHSFMLLCINAVRQSEQKVQAHRKGSRRHRKPCESMRLCSLYLSDLSTALLCYSTEKSLKPAVISLTVCFMRSG